MTKVDAVEIQRGDGPIVLGMPHTGTFIPADIAAKLNDRGRKLTDTDWHIQQLYDGLLPGVTSVRATFHRYVIDANRDPAGASLYPGQNITALVPLTDFDGNNIWNHVPDTNDIALRTDNFHAPYHQALSRELERVRHQHGVVILYDCHSIRSRIAFLFAGTLPDFNIGTNLGTTCAAVIEAATRKICAAASGYSSVCNGRFQGGWTTRHYGRPDICQHAIQMELAQSAYLSAEAPPWSYDKRRAAQLRGYLTAILATLTRLAPTLIRDPLRGTL